MTEVKYALFVINGWSIFAHALFIDQLEGLTQKVETVKQKDPVGYINKNATKRLAAIFKLAFEVIPQDPTRAVRLLTGCLAKCLSVVTRPTIGTSSWLKMPIRKTD